MTAASSSSVGVLVRCGLAVMGVLLLSGCHDFQTELDRCLDGGHCSSEACDAGLDVCVVRADKNDLALRTVWAPATGNRYWTAGETGYIARCVADVCVNRSGDFSGDWSRLEGGANFDDVIVTGAASEARRFFADGGAAELAAGGANTLFATFMAQNGVDSWASGENAGIVRFELRAAIGEKTVDSSSETIRAFWGEQRPTIAVGNDANGAAMYWTGELGTDGGFGWLKHPLTGAPLRSIAGAAGGPLYVSRQAVAGAAAVLRLELDGGLEAEPNAPTSDVSNLWVSADGRHLFGVEGSGTLAHRRPDGSWNELVVPGLSAYDLKALYGQNDGHLWVVGQATPDGGLSGGIVARLRFNP